MPRRTMTHRLAAALAAGFSASAAMAQDNPGAHISIELNTLEPVENACRISFLIQNGHAVDIESAVYETVLFDTEGRVERLTLFDLGTLPTERPRVRQFLVPDLACASLGRILINGAETCSGPEVAPDACTRDLELLSKTGVEVLG